jgi:hypothetical protein
MSILGESNATKLFVTSKPTKPLTSFEYESIYSVLEPFQDGQYLTYRKGKCCVYEKCHSQILELDDTHFSLEARLLEDSRKATLLGVGLFGAGCVLLLLVAQQWAGASIFLLLALLWSWLVKRHYAAKKLKLAVTKLTTDQLRLNFTSLQLSLEVLEAVRTARQELERVRAKAHPSDESQLTTLRSGDTGLRLFVPKPRSDGKTRRIP